MKLKIAITGILIFFLLFIMPFIATATSPETAGLYAKQVENSNEAFIMKDSYSWFIGTIYFFVLGALVLIWKNTVITFFKKENKV